MSRCRFWLIFSINCLALLACQEKPTILLMEDAQTVVPQPLYRVDEESEYMTITTMYQVFEGSEGNVDTYFLEASDGDTIRVARLRTCSACTLVGLPGETDDPVSLNIGEPINQTAHTCSVDSNIVETEPYQGPQYITCLYWIDAEGYGNKIYSIWENQETISFLQSLIRLNK